METFDVTTQYARDVLSGKSNPYQDNDPVFYDAYFNVDQPPYFNMIRSKIPGLGFVAFLHFLNYVGAGQEFYSSDFTPDGKKLFDKAVTKGVIRQVPKQPNMHDQLGRHTWWVVTADPLAMIRQIAQI